jgi:16S rRNA (uracil1498-N3)-methyltransferase
LGKTKADILASETHYSIFPVFQCSRNLIVRRFFVEEIDPQNQSLVIRGPEAKHITRVLRMGMGDRLILMDRRGFRFQCRIESLRGHEVRVILEKPLPAPPESPVGIILCQALLKARAMDFVVQKASELGVERVQPFTSERTVVQTGGQSSSAKVRHWREIALNAAKQSNRAGPPEIALPCSLFDLAARWEHEAVLKMILWEDEKTQDLKALLRGSAPWTTIVGIVGPEGGLSPEEVQMIGNAGFRSVSLGARILRAETAAMTFVAVLQYEWGDLSL